MTRTPLPRTLFFVGLLIVTAPQNSAAAQTRAFVAATDFSSGSLANITFGPPRTATPNVATISSDPVVRWYGGLVYVVNRLNFDNIQVLDPANGFSVVRQFSVGNGANPHDIEFVSTTKAYVTRYDRAELLIVNPSTGAAIDSISLAGFADSDGIPEMDHLAIRNGLLFVSIQALDRNDFYALTGGSTVVVIDVDTNAIVDVDHVTPSIQGISLPAQDPFTELVTDPFGRILVGCVNTFGSQDGAVVRIDPSTLTASTEITEAVLGGDINDVAVLDGTHAFAVVSDPSFNTVLRAYRRDLGTAQTLVSSSGFFLADMEVNDRGELWVCDRNFVNPGVRVFDATSHAELTTSPLSTGLPPQDIAFDGAPPLVDVGTALANMPGLTVRSIEPNPSRATTRFELALERGTAEEDCLNIDLVDIAGRLVWDASIPITGSGQCSVQWDGRTTNGMPARAGVYFLRARTRHGSAVQSFVRIQ